MNISAGFTLDSPISVLSGVGKTRQAQLNSLGIYTLRDLVYHFPRDYQNRGDVLPLSSFDSERPRSYVLTVATSVTSAKIKNRITISKLRAFDESGSCEIVFFNSPYVKDVFHVGSSFRFYGKCAPNKMGRLTMQNPKYEPIIEGVALSDMTPIYPLTEGLSSKILDKLIASALSLASPFIFDPLPENIRIERGLATLGYALKNIHSPDSLDALRAAERRLSFDELLRFGLAVSLTASKRQHGEGARFKPTSLSPFTELLGYELTDSQKRAVNDVYRDTVLSVGENGNPPTMARIIVGDVGCGKTVCAEMAMYIAAKSSYQSVLMVPTEILAVQHYNEIKERFDALGIRTALLTGSTRTAEKKRIYESIASGDIDVLVGTHAVLSDKLEFAALGLIITDEQHRFGVRQRALLKDKVKTAHMLVMSATPIPRTLALVLYGDLEVSRITDMPKGRMRVDTYVVDESYRKRIDAFIEKEVAAKGQCYVVCPAIERDEDSEDGEDGLKSAVSYAKQMSETHPTLTVALLHGKMKAKEKDAVMQDFALGKIQVLISTTVIEVGVNVPNASLMIVENADRFGLSQLHQLRGRVGRGKRKSYCILISDSKSERATARLDVMKSCYDGYEIAEKDLELRGPGDFFSSNSNQNLRQSGGIGFNLASRCTDPNLPFIAFETAKNIIANDPTLSLAENEGLRKALNDALNTDSTIS